MHGLTRGTLTLIGVALAGVLIWIGVSALDFAGGWIVAAAGPDGSWLSDHVQDWSSDIGIGGLIADLIPAWLAFAIGVGLVFGLTFDTTGPRTDPVRRCKRGTIATPAAQPEAEARNGRPGGAVAHSRQGSAAAPIGSIYLARAMNAATPQPTRGLNLILEHCARLNTFQHVRPSAVLRLEELVGGDLARLLLSALAGDHRSRPQPI